MGASSSPWNFVLFSLELRKIMSVEPSQLKPPNPAIWKSNPTMPELVALVTLLLLMS